MVADEEIDGEREMVELWKELCDAERKRGRDRGDAGYKDGFTEIERPRERE